MVCLMNQITAGLCVYTDHVLLMCKISMVSRRALPFIRRQVIMLSGVPHPKALGGGAGDWYRAAKACYYVQDGFSVPPPTACTLCTSLYQLLIHHNNVMLLLHKARP